MINLSNCEVNFLISLQDISLAKENIFAFTYNFTICFNWYSMNTYSFWFRVSSPHIFHLFFLLQLMKNMMYYHNDFSVTFHQ